MEDSNTSLKLFILESMLEKSGRDGKSLSAICLFEILKTNPSGKEIYVNQILVFVSKLTFSCDAYYLKVCFHSRSLVHP
jgi:hypothetical protein